MTGESPLSELLVALGFAGPVINALHVVMEVEDPNDFSLGDFACLSVEDTKDVFKGFTFAQKAKLNNAHRQAQNKGATHGLDASGTCCEGGCGCDSGSNQCYRQPAGAAVARGSPVPAPSGVSTPEKALLQCSSGVRFLLLSPLALRRSR